MGLPLGSQECGVVLWLLESTRVRNVMVGSHGTPMRHSLPGCSGCCTVGTGGGVRGGVEMYGQMSKGKKGVSKDHPEQRCTHPESRIGERKPVETLKNPPNCTSREKRPS